MALRYMVMFGAAGIVSAQQKALSLEDCIRLAEGAPSQLTLARQEREIAAREITKAHAGFLPRTQLGSGFTYNSPRPDHRDDFSFVALNGVREFSSLVAMIQELDSSGRLRAESARARAESDAAGAGEGIARRELKRAVTLAYYRLLLARHLAQVIGDALRESENFEKRARLLLESGEAARADVVKAAAQTAFLRQSLNAALLQAGVANQELASFWTSAVSDTLEIQDLLEQPPPAAEAATGAPGQPFLRRLEFNLLDAQRRVFDADARRARAALLPQASVVFQYGLDANAVRIRERGYAAFFNLTIPLFDWFRARSETLQFRLRAQQVDTSRAISERTLSAEYYNALRRVRELYAQIGLTSEQVKLAQEDLSLSRVRYEGGEGLALDVVTAQNQLAQARSNYYANVANYLIARLDLEVASGR